MAEDKQPLKRGLMTQFPFARGRAFVCKNIGDYVQAVASKQFVNPVDEYIEQEEACFYHSSDGRKIRLIMNGWFQWRAENWPPSKDIVPLLVSMHISPIRKDQLLTPQGIEFLRKNAPVGCRDYYTENLLKSVGIPCYFSACATLTLGLKYKISDSSRRSGYYFVDPFFEIPPLYLEEDNNNILDLDCFNSFIEYYSRHSAVINQLALKPFFAKYSPTGFLDRDDSVYRPLYKAYCFYKVYSKLFADSILLEADYITHWVDVDMSKATNDDLLNYAETLICKYAGAKMVITSRIHAGLPCLATETPVVFVASEQVTSENGTFNTPGRLGGLLDLFRIVRFNNGELSSNDEVLMSINLFTEETSFTNKDDYRPYAEKLSAQLSEFMK